MKIWFGMAVTAVLTAQVYAQTTVPADGTQKAAPAAQAPVQTPTRPAPSLQLQGLAPSERADPFPPVDPKNFTADSPSVATVESYLHEVLGYDSNRLYKVLAIEKTAAAGVSRVIIGIADRAGTAKMSTAVLFILPDGKHMISADASGGTVTGFAARPYAENRATLDQRADGPAMGAASKDLLLVEFTDLQCPRCKDAQPVMARLAADFPRARIVVESFPLTQVHPFAYQAATYGACMAQKSSESFFKFADAVFATQGSLLPESADATLKAAVTQAGQDPAAIAACAATPAAKASVDAGLKLGRDLGVDQTPTLAVNGRLLPLNGIPYETLRSVINFEAAQAGIPASAPNLHSPAAVSPK